MSKKISKIIGKIILIIFVLLLLVVGAFQGCTYYFSDSLTTLYSNETESGHTVKVVQKGRYFLVNFYTFFIEVDGIRVAKFKVMIDNDYCNEHFDGELPQLYPKELITIIADGDTEYRLEFLHRWKNYAISFDADFEKILYVYAYDFECLVEDMPVIVDDSQKYDMP